MANLALNCPTPLQYQHIVMAHGGGGRLMQQLLSHYVQATFDNPILNQQHDSAVLDIGGARLAFTTDSYVIKPLFFPGGDIGKLAVCGTLNDLAMSGARPLYLSCSLIIEEGLPLDDLQRILDSMQATAAEAGVVFVTGDTKVVDRGKGDGLYINTAGIGVIDHAQIIHPESIQPGDAIIVNSDIARHGMAVMLEREGLAFEHAIESDCADVSGLIKSLLEAGVQIHCLRDLTRGGLASILIELADASRLHFEIQEKELPIQPVVRSACDILGFDPLYVANEGCFALFCPPADVPKTLEIMQQNGLGKQARQIGSVGDKTSGSSVTLRTNLGISRGLSLLSGEQLPRIC